MKTGIYWQNPAYPAKGMDFILDLSLVLYLPLYRLDGASFMSKDAGGHLCTVTGAFWTPKGRSFDGSDDRIVVPDHAALNITTPLTMELWANMAVLVNRPLLFKPYVASFTACNYGMATRYNTNALQVGFGDGGQYRLKFGGAVTGGWHHLAGVIVSADDIRVYIDGEDVGGAYEGPVTTLTAMAGNLELGHFGALWLEGLIGEVRVYNRGLTPLEIHRNYLATKWRYQ